MMKYRVAFSLAIVCLVLSCGGNNSTGGSNNGNAPTDAGADQSTPDATSSPDAGNGAADLDTDAPDARADAEGNGGQDLGGDADMDIAPVYDDPAGASGTRLRRRYLEAAPGAYMTVDLFDNQLMTPCSFGTASDGSLRCLPRHPVDLAFKDASCTQPIYVVTDSFCDSEWMRDRVDGSYYRKTATPAVVAGVIYRASGGSCLPISIDAGAEPWDAEPVDPAEFVAGATVDEARSDNLVARYVEGEDGSRILTAVVHRTRGYACAFDEDETCVPDVSMSLRYLDAGCTDKVFASRVTAPPLLREDNLDGRFCAVGYNYYERGAAVTPVALFYRTSSGACASAAISDSTTYYRAGMAIAKDTLGQAMIAVEGEEALRARRRVDADGKPLGAVHEFVDVASGVGCREMELSEERGFVCATTARGHIDPSHFEDSSCTTNIGFTFCDAAIPPILTRYGAPSCTLPGLPVVEAAFERGTAAGPNYFFSNEYNPACEPRTYDSRYQAHSLGAEITQSLPRLELQTE